MKGELPGCPRIYFSIADVRDAAELHLLAIHDPATFGHRVFAAGPSIEFVEVAKTLAEAFPAYAKKIPTRRLPDFVVRLVAMFDGDVKTAAMNLGRQHEMDKSLLEPLLGRPLIDTSEAIRSMGQSLIDLGQV